VLHNGFYATAPILHYIPCAQNSAGPEVNTTEHTQWSHPLAAIYTRHVHQRMQCNKYEQPKLHSGFLSTANCRLLFYSVPFDLFPAVNYITAI